ncbi:MAG: dihydrolipoyl dehydrogenase [Synergistaceae bacterium]|jgi:dihydrolipoamide dehydrogenase|nr:dihydrolipoyl dehydrogenase [Synergistaceae bacterium]
MIKRIVVIGAGPGGYVAAVRAAHLGRMSGRETAVTLIEKKAIGGTCLNVGCIPTKVLLHSAELLTSVKSEAKRIGVLVDNPRLDWNAVMKRKAMTVSRLATGTLDLVKSNGIEYVEGEAVLRSASSVQVGGRTIEADAVVVATGSEPDIPDIPGLDTEGVVTSDEALSFGALPASIAISGGGVIGMEFAAAFASFGVKVTVIVTSPEILRSMDPESAVILRKALEKKGVSFLRGCSVAGVTKADNGLKIALDSEAGPKEILAEKLLVAKGRRPYTLGLGLEALGVTMERGRILTDRHMETNVRGVYAIGDCVNSYMLAHVASREGEVAVENIFAPDRGGRDVEMDYTTTPGCVYTSPELASVGLTEREAEKKGHRIRVGRFPLITNGKSAITGDNGGMMKVVADEDTKKILGVHMAGGPATEMISEAALALHFGATPEDLVQTIHAHPTVYESLAEAAANVFGTAIHTAI